MKDLATKLLQKADRAITAAETLLPTDPEAAANRAYYALFYVADALLAQRDLRFSKHAGVHSACEPAVLNRRSHSSMRY